MPTSTTSAPDRFDSATIFVRLSRVNEILRPRSPSFAPSSTTTTAGRCSSSARESRCNPPPVVSPLTLALTTLYPYPWVCSRCSSKATQPWADLMPYPALRLSPSTRTVRSGAAIASEHAMSHQQTASAQAAPENLEVVLKVENLTKQVNSPEGLLT